MHSQYAESQSSNEFGQQHAHQNTIFQKYSRISSNNQHSQDHAHQQSEPQYESDNYPDVEEITPIAQTKVVDSNMHVLSEDDHQEKSLIESVAKEESCNDLQFISQSNQDLPNVPQASSKIIHQAVSRHDPTQYVQTYQQQPHVNSSVAMQPQRVMNHSANYQQPQVHQNYHHQQNTLRHTISNNVSPRQMVDQMGPGQQLIMRGSLPPNLSAQQFVMNKGSVQQNYGQVQQQISRQMANQRQFQMMPSSPQLRQQQLIPQQPMGMVEGILPHQQPQQHVRVPNHVPQSLVPVKNIQSQTLVQTVNFIKNGPQRLETSEIVYKNRNPAIVDKTQSQMQVQVQPLQNNVMNAHYHQQNLQQQNAQMIQRGSAQMIERGSSQGQSGISGDAVRSNTRSLQRRQTNVVFNYNVHQQQPQQQPLRVNNQINQQVIQQLPQQQARSVSVSPVPISLPHPPVLPKPQMQSPSPQQIIQQKPPITSTTQVVSKQQVSLRNQWKQRYFGLYQRLETVNKKVEYITEEFHIYEKLVQVSHEQKILKKHSKIMNTVQQLQQQCVSIVHEWRPTSEFKSNPNKSKEKVQSVNAQKDKKDQGHLEMKYKRLLFNYSKVQEENQAFKKSFQDKIHQVVKKLQTENTTLTKTIKKLQAQNNLLSSEVSELRKSQARPKQQPRLLQVPQVQQSDDLTLSESLKLQLQESIARYHQQNRFLQDELQRVNEQLDAQRLRNQQLIEAMRVMEQQLQQQTNQRERGEVGDKPKTIGMESIENIIQELNQKIVQYQLKLTTICDQMQRVNYVKQQIQEQNHQLRQYTNQLEQKCHQLSNNVSNNVTNSNNNVSNSNNNMPQTNLMENPQYRQLQQELKNKQQQLMNAVSDVETLQANNFMLNTELQRLNQKILSLETLLENTRTSYQINTAKETTTNNQKGQLEKLQIENSKLYQQNVSLRDQLDRINDQVSRVRSKLSAVTYQLEAANENSHKLQQQLDDSQMNLADYNIKISNFQHQIQQLQSVIQSSNNHFKISNKPTIVTSNEPINPSPILIQQYEFTIATLRSQINRKQSEIQRQARLSDQRILDLTEQLKLAYKERQSLHKKYEEKTLLLQGERQKKQILIRELRDRLYDLQQKRRIQDVEQTRNRQYIAKLSTINQSKQIAKLTHQLQSTHAQNNKLAKQNQTQSLKLKQQIQQLTQDNSRLKKQIGQFTHTINELQQMSQALTKKNMEILDLKNVAFQSQKLTIDNTNIRKQLERQLQDNSRLQGENDKLQRNLLQGNKAVKQLESNLQSVNSRLNSLQNQHKQSQQVINTKELQIHQFRLAVQSAQQQLLNSTKQQQKILLKLKNLQIAHQQQSLAFKDQHQSLRAKQLELDQLIKDKSITDHKLTELQAYKQKYEYQLKENQELITKQKSKLKLLQSQNQDLHQQVQSFKQKYTEIQKKSQEQTKKYKKIVQQVQQKNKHLQQKQLKFQKQKIHELQTQLKTKDNKIWKLQKQLEELLERLDQVGDQQINAQKIIFLQQKVKDYQARLFTQVFKYTPTNYDYQATKVFEEKVIYELKQQNQKLKDFITQKKSLKPTSDKISSGNNLALSGNNLGLSRAEMEMKQAYDDELDQVQGRLTAFNHKLQSLINNGTYDPTANNQTLKKTRKSPSKLTNNPLNQRQLPQSSQPSRQLKQLRTKYSQLQRYCKNIQVQLLSGKSQKTITSNNVVTVSSNSIAHNEVTFLKEKNKELDERVQKLLKMNTQLKDNMEHLLQQRNDHSTLGYYKQQITQLNQKITVLEQRVKKLLEENDRVKAQLGSYNKNEESGQVKLFQVQRKLVEMQRTVNELTHVKSSLQSELKARQELLQNRLYEINELRNQLSLSGEKQSSIVMSLKQKLENSQTDIVKLSQKLKISQSQMQRLNQVIKKKQSDTSQQITRWRTKVNQLQQQLNRIGEQKQQQKSGQSTLKIQISRLSQQIKSINFYNQQIKQTNQSLIKKLQQSQSKLRQLNIHYEQLENSLSSQRLQEQQWIIKFQQQQQQSARLNNQIQILKQQIQRINEQMKNKQRNNDIQLHSLHEKLTLSERELLNLRKNVSLVQSDKQVLQDQLNRLKTYIAQLTHQLQDNDQSHKNKQGIYEQKNHQLKMQITQIQSHSTSSQHVISDLTIYKQRIESQLVQHKNQISILKSQIQRITILVRDKDSAISSLNTTINSFKQQSTKDEQEIAKLISQVHLLKEQIDRLNFVIVEKDSTILSLRSKNESILLEKDNLEREISQALMQVRTLKDQNQRLLAQIQQLQQFQHNNRSSSSSQVTGLSNQVYSLKKDLQESRIIIKTLQVQRDNDQRQIASWISQFNLLKQQNLVLVNKIAQLQATYLSAIKISPNEFQALKAENQDLRQSLRVMQEKLSIISRDITSLVYFVELNRSIILQIEALLDHKLVSTGQEIADINYKISQQIAKGLNLAVQIKQKLNHLV